MAETRLRGASSWRAWRAGAAARLEAAVAQKLVNSMGLT